VSNLGTYLNDHLAGSVGALEMLDRLVTDHPETHFFADLRVQIQDSQDQLRQLIADLGVAESSVRKAGAWVAEKFSRAKIRDNDAYGVFLALEMLLLGLTGQAALWRALQKIAPESATLRRLDLQGLHARATRLAEEVENARLEMCRAAFIAEER
jgi:hypothetical protein